MLKRKLKGAVVEQSIESNWIEIYFLNGIFEPENEHEKI
jgi:hypothetical protein